LAPDDVVPPAARYIVGQPGGRR